MISQTAEYALRAATCLAAAGGKPLTNRQIAKLAKIPAGYLSKVLQALRRAGSLGAVVKRLLRSHRGY